MPLNSHPDVAPGIDISIDRLRDYFLQRLQRLLTRRMLGARVLDATEARFVDQAIFSTYRELQVLGCAFEAGIVIRHYRKMRPRDR